MMRAAWGSVIMAGSLSLCMAAALMLWPARPAPGSRTPSTPAPPLQPRPLASPSQSALDEAHGWHRQALAAAAQEYDELEEWDPNMPHPTRLGVWRGIIARDRTGSMGFARAAARRAAALARTKPEAYAAAMLLAILECQSGQPRAELQQARRLMELAPEIPGSLIVLRHAAKCNGIADPPGQADALLKAIEKQAPARRALGSATSTETRRPDY